MRHTQLFNQSNANHCWQEYLFVASLLVCVFLIGSIPYVYGYAVAAEGERFMGLVGRGPVGGWGYLMFAEQSRRGHFFSENRMTSEVLPYPYFNLEWWSFGAFSRLLGVSLITTYHLGRLFSIALFLSALYYLCAICLGTAKLRATAMLAIVFGSGMGWVIWLINHLSGGALPEPLDIQGVSIPLYLVFKPHFIRTAAMATFTMAFIIRGEQTGKHGYFLLAGMAAALHTAMRPYPLPEILLTCIAIPTINYFRVGETRWRGYAVILAFIAPSIVYYAYLRYFHVLGFNWWNATHHMFIQDALWIGWPFLACFGLLAVMGFVKPFMNTPATMTLSLWLLIALGINNLYPYFDGGHENSFNAFAVAPPVLLLCFYMEFLRDNVRTFCERRTLNYHIIATLASIVAITSLLPSSVIAYSRVHTHLHIHKARYYVSEDVYDALLWLADNSTPEKVVFALPITSQFIPAIAGNKIVAAHFMLTAHWEQKEKEVHEFFHGNSGDAQRFSVLSKYNASYLLVGPEERQALKDWPDKSPQFTILFSKDHVSLYAFSNTP